jgi:outer membrane protein assembly factor BamB
VTSNGGVFRIDAAKAKTAAFEEPVAAAETSRFHQPFDCVLRLADDWTAISSGKGGDPIGVFDSKAPSPMIYWPKLSDQITCAPAVLGRGLLIPGKAGQVFLLNPQSGEPLAEAFQPRLEPGAEFDWIAPTTVKGEEVLLTDGKSKIYRLGIQDQPKPHLAVLAEAAVSKRIVAPPAVLGETFFMADEAGGLTSYELSKLARIKDIPLGSRCAWGPAKVGDCVLVSTDNDQLFCFDAKGNQLWQKKLEYGPLAGDPLLLEKNMVLASRSGIVWKVDAATGKELGKVNAGCPLGTGPALFTRGGGSSSAAPTVLFVGGHDGTLYEVRQP